MKTVSVVVVTQDRSAVLLTCLESLVKQDFPREFEIVVADDGSTDDTESVVRAFAIEHPNVIYAKSFRQGSTEASHVGFRAATGEIVAYADDDTICDSNWLRELVEPFNDPQVACVGGRILPKWEAQPPSWIERYRTLLALLDLGPNTFEVRWPISLFGCNMAVERDWFIRVGGFNPDMIGSEFVGDGETGFEIKLWKAGAKVVYAGSAVLHHRIPASRLRFEYFLWRFAGQGVATSYLAFRQDRSIVRLAIRVPLLAIAYLGFSLTARLAPVSTHMGRHSAFRAAYCKSRLQTEWSFLTDDRYRARALQDDWFSAPDPGPPAREHADA